MCENDNLPKVHNIFALYIARPAYMPAYLPLQIML